MREVFWSLLTYEQILQGYDKACEGPEEMRKSNCKVSLKPRHCSSLLAHNHHILSLLTLETVMTLHLCFHRPVQSTLHLLDCGPRHRPVLPICTFLSLQTHSLHGNYSVCFSHPTSLQILTDSWQTILLLILVP